MQDMKHKTIKESGFFNLKVYFRGIFHSFHFISLLAFELLGLPINRFAKVGRRFQDK